MADESKVQSGDDFHPSARDWNAFLDAAAAHKRRLLGEGGGDPALPIPTDCIKIQNSTGGDLPRGTLLSLGDKLLTELEPHTLWYDAIVPVCGPYIYDPAPPFGILREPIPDGEIGDCQIAGACLARVYIHNTGHRRAFPKCGQSILYSGDCGPFTLLGQPPGLTEQEMGVLFTYEERYIGRTEELIAAGGTGRVSRFSLAGVDIGVDDSVMSWCSTIQSGRNVAYSRRGHRFVVDEHQCNVLPTDDV